MKRSLAAILLVLSISACKGEEAIPAVVPATDRVRAIDLPQSRRGSDSLGTNAVPVLIALDAIAIDARDVVPLTRGALAAGIGDAAPIPALAAALPAGKTEARLRMHAATKTATLLSVIATLRAHGITKIGFDVRTDSLGEHTGTLVPAVLDARAATREPPTFPEPYARAWDVIAEVWDDAYDACSGSDGSFDCSRVPTSVAFGGDAEIGIFRRGAGFILDFTRFNAGENAAAPTFADTQNTRTEVRNRDAMRAAAPPATSASFGFRWQSLATEPEAPVAKAMRELSRPGPVGIRLSADASSDAGSLVTLLGAAFPNDVPSPAVMLDAQRR